VLAGGPPVVAVAGATENAGKKQCREKHTEETMCFLHVCSPSRDGKLRNQIRPITTSNTTMSTTTPRTPLGPYPQLLLYGQLGIAPINSKTTTINNNAPSDIFNLLGRLAGAHMTFGSCIRGLSVASNSAASMPLRP
jgi:hypothetical protein